MDDILSITHSLHVRGRGVIAVAHGPGEELGPGAILEQSRAGIVLRTIVVRHVEYFADGRGHNVTDNWGIVIKAPEVTVDDLVAGDILRVRVPTSLPSRVLRGREPVGL